MSSSQKNSPAQNSSLPSRESLAHKRWVNFFLLTILIATVGYFIIMGLFYFFSRNVAGAQKWSLFDGFVGVVSLSLLIGGLAYTVRDRIRSDIAEAREKSKISYEIYRSIYEKLTDPQQEAARRWILTNIRVPGENEDIQAWFKNTQTKIMACENRMVGGLPEGQRSVKMTLNCLDYIGFIVKHYWDIKEEDASLDWLSPPIAKVWSRLKPYVYEIRRQRKADDYYEFAEHIGRLCIERRRYRNLPDEEMNDNIP